MEISIHLGDRLISRARTVRGLVRWAYETASNPGSTSRWWLPRQVRGKPGPGNFTQLDAITEASWILGHIRSLPAHLRAVVASAYGQDRDAQAELVRLLTLLEPSIPQNLAVCVVWQWCGEDFSIRKFRRLTGCTERAAREGRAALREHLIRWDEGAVIELRYAFEKRGWLEE